MAGTEGPSSITRSPAGIFQSNQLSALLFMKTNSPHGPEQWPSTDSKVGRSKKRSAEEAVGVKKSPKPKASKASKAGFGPLMETFQAQPGIEDHQPGPHPPTTGSVPPSSSSVVHGPGFLPAHYDTLSRLLALSERHRQQEFFHMERQRLVALQRRRQLLLKQRHHQLRSEKRSAEEAVGVNKSPKPKASKASKTGLGPLMETFQAQPRIEDHQLGPHSPTTWSMPPSSSSAAHAPGFLLAHHDTLHRLLALAERHRQQELFEMRRQRLVALQTRKKLLLVQGRHQLPVLSSFNDPLLGLELELARRSLSGPSSLRQPDGLASTTPLSRQREAAMRGAKGISDHSLTEAAYKNHLSSAPHSCRNTVSNATIHLIERYSSSDTIQAPFPVKLHSILSKPEFQDLITWLPHGQAWRVLKPTAFENVVIPHFFRHAKYSSFMRQVIGWGFQRTVQGVEHNSYYHQLFSRDDPERCMQMKRIGASKSAAGELVEDPIPSAASEKTDTDEQDQGPIGDKQEMAEQAQACP